MKKRSPETMKKIRDFAEHVLFALADLAYWFVTYQNNLTIRGWMK